MNVAAFETPFRYWIIDGLVEPDMVRAAHDCLPRPEWAGWVRYRNDVEAKRTSRELGLLGDPVQRLMSALTSAGALVRLSYLTCVFVERDPTWHGAGIHISDPGDYLNCHLDYAAHPTLPLERRLSLVLFLNPQWWEEWGGALELYQDDAHSVAKRIFPACNRAVLFENSDLSYHGTQMVAADAPPRITAAVYFLAPPRPGCVRRRALFAPRR